MANDQKPKWLNLKKIAEQAKSELEQKMQVKNSVPKVTTEFKQISAYTCPNCRLKFSSGQIEPQLRKSARNGYTYVECPKCGATLTETHTVQVKNPTPLVNRANYYKEANRHPNAGRVPNMWVDKAIYGKLVQNIGNFVAKFGIMNPQMRFQRGIRSSKFPGEPHSAKGAEFSVEFIDQNNTRNRIFIQAGLTPKGEFIYPRIFKTTSGQEYPLTKEAVDNLTSGKLFNPVVPNMAIPPLIYRDRDYTRFREISADSNKMKKVAFDPTDPTMPTGNDMADEDDLQMKVQEMGISSPEDQEAVKDLMRKYVDPNNPEAFAPGMSSVQPGGNFMQGLGLGVANKLNLTKISKVVQAMRDMYSQAVIDALNDGLSYDEAVDDVYSKTGLPLNEEVWNRAANLLENEAEQSPMGIEAALADQLVAKAEQNMLKKFQKTAKDVQEEFDFNGMTSDESNNFTEIFLDVYHTYLASYNTTLNKYADYLDMYEDYLKSFATVPEKATRFAHMVASTQLHESRIKNALRDEQTLVPFVDTDPYYSLAEQTVQSEPRFDKPDGDPLKYNETDGGISDPKDRNITDMFGRNDKLSSKTADVYLRQKDGEWEVVDDKGHVHGTHTTEKEAKDQMAAIYEKESKEANVKTAYITHNDGEYIVHSESGKELGKHKTKEEATKQLQAIEISKHKKGSKKTAAYEVTPSGENAINAINQGQPVGDFDPQALLSVLGYLQNNPYATTETLSRLADIVGMDPNTLQNTFRGALEQGLITIGPETTETAQTFWSQESPGAYASISKEGEATGVDLDPDEVGQNPINYSRYKAMVEDEIRAGNIPPTKVDLHALKDNKYSLEDLKDLVQTFKSDNKAVMYPTTHASQETLQKLAEQKLSDIFKEMPMEKVEEDTDEGKENFDYGGEEPPLTRQDIKMMHEEMSDDSPAEDTIKGGNSDNVPDAAFDVEQLTRGIKVEYEHTKDPEKAKEIAKDHLMEDPAYYVKLNQMEHVSPPRDVEELHDALTAEAAEQLAEEPTPEKGQAIADALGLWFHGLQEQVSGPPFYVLTDPETKSTILADSLEDAKQRLEKTRLNFQQNPPRGLNFATKKAQEELPKGTILGPHGEVVSTPKEEEELTRLAPPKFLTRKEPGVEETEAVEATPEESALMKELEESKRTVDATKINIQALQQELQTKIAPLQTKLGAEGQNQMRATKALVGLMQKLNHSLIQADNQIAHYTEIASTTTPPKLTPSDKVAVLLERFGAEAVKAINDAEKNLGEIQQITIGRLKQWPKKTSADIGADDQYLAALYQNTYNSFANLLDLVDNLNIALAA